MPTSSASGLIGPSWFPVAVGALAFLAGEDDAVCPSATIAQHMRSHAAFLRRVFAQLVRAGLVEAREGREGGYRLARPADRITLADVYRALKSCDAPAMELPPSLRAPVLESRVGVVLGEVMSEAEERALSALERHTIAEVAARAS